MQDREINKAKPIVMAILHSSVMRKSLASDFRIEENVRLPPQSAPAGGGGNVHILRNAKLACEQFPHYRNMYPPLPFLACKRRWQHYISVMRRPLGSDFRITEEVGLPLAHACKRWRATLHLFVK